MEFNFNERTTKGRKKKTAFLYFFFKIKYYDAMSDYRSHVFKFHRKTEKFNNEIYRIN